MGNYLKSLLTVAMNTTNTKAYWPQTPLRSLQWTLVLLGAVGYCAGHQNPFIVAPYLVLLTPFSLYMIVDNAPSAKQSFALGWLMGILGLSPTLYWLTYPIHNVGELPIILAIPCIILLGSYLGLFTGLTALGMHHTRSFLYGHTKSPIVATICHVLLSGFVFAGFEVVAGTLFSGFPWYNLGSAFAVWLPWAQAASLVGSYGVSAVYCIGACFIGAACAKQKHRALLLLFLGCATIASIPLYGSNRLANKNATPSLAPPISFGLVQGNVDQNQKWEATLIQQTVTKYLSLSQALVNQQKNNNPSAPISLIIWPETSMPFVYNYATDFAEQLQQFAIKNNIPLAFGTLGYRPATANTPQVMYNRLQVVSAHGTRTYSYDKQHLVPFGEYIPFALNIPFLQNILQGISFAPGNTSSPLLVAPKSAEVTSSITQSPYKLGILICYEVIFPNLARDRVTQGATILLTISNDAWFGNSSAPLQHLGMAAMRCIEQMRPMVRSTNTGITASISKYGEITTYGTLFTEDTAIVSVSPESTITPFQQYGFFIQYFLLCISIASIVLQPLYRKLFSPQFIQE